MRIFPLALTICGAATLGGALPACGDSVPASAPTKSHAKNGGGTSGGTSDVLPGGDQNGGPYADLPGVVIESGAPDGAAGLFDGSGDGSGAGPCLVEPQAGTLYPKNWLRPRFSWIGSGANLYELRLTVENQTQELVVYTTATTWTMPSDTWNALQQHSTDVAMSVRVRGGNLAGGALSGVTTGSGGDLRIAPVEAPGSIVYWALKGDDQTQIDNQESLLRGFSIGEEGLVDVLRGPELPAYNQNGRKCIGCHTSTPDGKSVGVSWALGANLEDDPLFASDIATIEKGQTPGPTPSFVGPAAKTALANSEERMYSSFSRAHWTAGDRLMLTNANKEIVWIDLEATSAAAATGVLGRFGDPNPRGFGPSWSHDGTFIAYMSAGESAWGGGTADIYTMPFANRAGATSANPAQPVAGASDPSRAEYYPSLSPDDAWIAFTAASDDQTYNNPLAEILVVPTAGGSATRLTANDPPACLAKPSPGITNSWPKWAPEVGSDKGRKYYFVAFSSRRHPGTERSQIYVAPIVVAANGDVTTYSALYLWNQESQDSWQQWGNHTPAWDSFVIPSAPIK